jgi:hypothetical protein
MESSNRKQGRVILLLTEAFSVYFVNLSQRGGIFPESARALLPLKNTSGTVYAYAMGEWEGLSSTRTKEAIIKSGKNGSHLITRDPGAAPGQQEQLKDIHINVK